MVFNKLKGDHKKCYGLLLVLFTIFGCFSDAYLGVASAISLPFTQFGLYESYYTMATGCHNYQYQEGYAYNQLINLCSARAFLAETEQVQSTGEYWSASGKVNIVRRRVFRLDGTETNSFVNLHKIDVLNTSHAGTALTIQSTSVQTFKTKWQVSDSEKYETLTVQYNVSGKGAVNAYGAFRILIGSPSFAFFWPNETETVTPYSGIIYFENTYETPNVNFSGSFSDGSSATIINQNNTIINQNDQIINQNNEYYNHEYQAEDNISGQSANDIQGATNAQTTSIIGTISSFVSALGNVQAGSCELTLPFPSFVGGQQVVNPCTGKDKAPTIVQIGSSMLLIVFFVPLAFIVLKMIYNEIRSWTNG